MQLATASVDRRPSQMDWTARVPSRPGRTEHPADPLKSIRPFGVVTSYGRGQTVFREGDAATHWYQVVSGAVRTCKLLPDGRRQIGEFLLAGDVFGFEAGADCSIDVETIGAATLIRFPLSRIRTATEDNPRLAAQLEHLAFESVAQARSRLLVLARQTALERLAGFLLEMQRRTSPGADAFDLPMQRQDVADYLCLTIETVSRVLSDLRREKVIAIPSAQRVVILDSDALEDAAGS